MLIILNFFPSKKYLMLLTYFNVDMVETYVSCIFSVFMYISVDVSAYCICACLQVYSMYSIFVRVYSIYWEQLPLINCLWGYITTEVSARMPSADSCN